jgi:YidC/Oxa1 family membrane protein insertase
MNAIIPVDAQLGDGFKYGIFQGFVVFPMGYLINILTTTLGSAAIAMVIVTIIVRTITLPVTIKGQEASVSLQALQPKMAEVEEKYRGRTDAASNQQKQAEMQRIYSSMGVNPMLGMLYPFVSLPLFMGVWRATSSSQIIKDALPFLSFNMGVTPMSQITTGHYQYVVLIAVVGITQFIQFRLTNHLTNKRNKENKSYRANPKQDSQTKMMGIMMYGFTAMMVVMSASLISAMSFYLIVSALISIAQAFYIDKHLRKAQ